MELNEKQLENVLGGANREIIVDKALENKDVFREKSLSDIQREKEELIKQKEELLRHQEELSGEKKTM